MKYLDVRLTLPDWMLHPMQEFIRYEGAVRYEEMLAWRVRPDEDIEYALYYVERMWSRTERRYARWKQSSNARSHRSTMNPLTSGLARRRARRHKHGAKPSRIGS